MASRLFLSVCASVITTVVSSVIFYSIFPNFTFHYQSAVIFIFQVIFALFTYHWFSWHLCGGLIEPYNKVVFITGCDSGFGKELAKKLDSKGFIVFAGCLFPDGPGAQDLKNSCSDALQVLYIDVTKDESVKKAANFVKQNLGTADFWALVNNAGIYKGFSIALTPTEVFRELLEVNCIGQVRVTKAFLSLLRKSGGRVVNVTSLLGRVCVIGTGAYAVSKHAAVAFTETLSQEMNLLGIPVISIEPEGSRTPMVREEDLLREFEEILKTASEETLHLYGESYLKAYRNRIPHFTKSLFPLGIDVVIDAMESAVMDKYPNPSYKPRLNFVTRFVWYLSEIMPFGLYESLQLRLLRLLGCPFPATTVPTSRD